MLRPLLMLLTLLSALAIPSPAQAPADPLASFGEQLDVNVVNVDVYVTDRRGEPITGLTRDDFRLEVEGEPVEIANFLAVHEPRSRAVQTGTAPPGAEQAAATPLQMVVFFDNHNVRPQHRSRAIQQLRKFLDAELQPGDRVLLASALDEVTIHLGLSADREAIEAALEEIDDSVVQGNQMDSETSTGLLVFRNLVGGGRTGSNSAACRQELEPGVAQYARTLAIRTERAITTLERFVELLAGLPGRKALVYVSDGLHLRPGDDMARTLTYFCPDMAAPRMPDLDLTDQFQQLAKTANGARVTLYPLQPAPANVRSGAIANETEASLTESLALMARETGGKAFLHATDAVGSLTPLLEDAGTYYSLGFVSPATASGEDHRIEVEVARRGARVRHRISFRGKTVEERLAESLLGMLQLGGGANPLALTLESAGEPRLTAAAPAAGDEEAEVATAAAATASKPAPAGAAAGAGTTEATPATASFAATVAQPQTFTVELVLGVPLGNLALVPQGDHRQGRFAVYVLSQDAYGRRSPLSTADVPLSIPEERWQEASGQLFGYRLKLELEAGHHTVAVAVRDLVGNSTSYLSHPLTVDPEPASGPALGDGR